MTARAQAVVAGLLPILSLATAGAAGPPDVRKMDPPGWWAGHTVDPVRLLIRGRDLAGAVVEPTWAEVRVGPPRINDRGTALFVDVRIDRAAPPGDYPLTLRTAEGIAEVPFRVEAPLDAAGRFRGVGPDDVVYLLMPDRFRDGDPSNNAPVDSDPEANTRANPRGFHGGDLRGVIDRLPYLKELGVTAIWLTPWYENDDGLYRCDKPWCPMTSYHGYLPTDHYAVEGHFGDLATLRELVDEAHALGLKVLQDQILNHVGLKHPWVDDPPLPSWFHGDRSKHLLNAFRIDRLASPHAAAHERAAMLDGWFADELPDLDQDEPEVARYLIQNSLWWAGVSGIDGIRLDTAPYVSRRFLSAWSAALKRQYPDLWLVGEILDFNPVVTAFYQGGRAGWDGVDTGLDAVFDFPLWAASMEVFRGRAPASTLAARLGADTAYPAPDRLVTIGGNHDLPRYPSEPGATPEGGRLHMAFLLSTRGIPQIYSGDELGMPGGGDPDNRRDFPGGFPGDPRDATKPEGRTQAEEAAFSWTRDWLRLRREHPALRRGTLTDLHADDEAYVYARRDPDSGESVVVAFHRGDAPRIVEVRADSIGVRVGGRLVTLRPGDPAVPVEGEAVRLALPPRSATPWRVGR